MLNSWHISGVVKKHGVSGGKYPKLWILIASDPLVLDNKPYPSNNLFLNVSNYSTDTATKAGAQSQTLLKKLNSSESSPIFVAEAKISPIRRNRKNSSGEWEKYEDIGIQCSVGNISVRREPQRPDINLGIVSGDVIEQGNDKAKIFVEERYRVPKDNTWRARKIPVFLEGYPSGQNLVSRKIWFHGSVTGQDMDGNNKVFAIAKKGQYVII